MQIAILVFKLVLSASTAVKLYQIVHRAQTEFFQVLVRVQDAMQAIQMVKARVLTRATAPA